MVVAGKISTTDNFQRGPGVVSLSQETQLVLVCRRCHLRACGDEDLSRMQPSSQENHSFHNPLVYLKGGREMRRFLEVHLQFQGLFQMFLLEL